MPLSVHYRWWTLRSSQNPSAERVHQTLTIQINTRTAQDVALPDGSQIRTITSLDDLSLSAIDVLIVAVGTKSIRPILEQLQKKQDRSHMHLVMDTPPLRLSDLRRLNIFRGFRSVSVGEDWAKLSTILTAKKLIELGEIGDLRSIRLDHLSYRYHGLATLKELACVNAVRSIRRRPLGSGLFETKVHLKKNVVATTVEPRDYQNGRMLIAGTKGYISDFKLGVSAKARFEIQYPETTTGWYQPISLNDELQEPDEIETFMATLPFEYLQDNSRINRLKIRGFARLLEDIAGGVPAYPISSIWKLRLKTLGVFDFKPNLMSKR